MKKVFRIAGRYFWAVNGHPILDVRWVEWQGEKMWMKRSDQDRLRIEIVDPPEGRCPHCGEKL